jgi:hypothetical protein
LKDVFLFPGFRGGRNNWNNNNSRPGGNNYWNNNRDGSGFRGKSRKRITNLKKKHFQVEEVAIVVAAVHIAEIEEIPIVVAIVEQPIHHIKSPSEYLKRFYLILLLIVFVCAYAQFSFCLTYPIHTYCCFMFYSKLLRIYER